MQNDLTNAYSDLLDDLETQFNELTTLTLTQAEQIKRLITQNEQLQATVESLANENKGYLLVLQQANKESEKLSNENSRLAKENERLTSLLQSKDKWANLASSGAGGLGGEFICILIAMYIHCISSFDYFLIKWYYVA